MTITKALLLAAAVAACGVDVDTRIESQHAFVGDPIPLPPDPFLTCVWHIQPPANQNIGFTLFGYWGDKRGVRIHYGNYVSAGNYLEYKIEVIWSLPGCSGTVYYLRFPVTGIANHAEIEVRGGLQVLKGRLVSDQGSLPRLFNENNTALPTSTLGPFVLKSNMVGGASGMGDTIAFTLLDAQTLSRLPYPAFYNGALPVNVAQQNAIAAAHDEVIADNEYLYSFFTFRMALDAMTATDRQTVADNIDVVINQPGPIHNIDLLWNEAHHVNHAVTIGPAAVNVGFGGFFNGHRNLIDVVEAWLRAEPDVPAFGRVPAWDSALTVPAEFSAGIIPARYPPFTNGSLTGGSPPEVAYQAANVCANFASSLSASATLRQRLIDEELALKADIEPWHNSVHTATVRGDFAPISFSASVPLFYPWHKMVDVLWNNWQLCEAAYHPLVYGWDPF